MDYPLSRYYFDRADLKAPLSLAAILCRAQDPLAQHLQERLGQVICQKLEDCLQQELFERLVSLVVEALNSLLSPPSLYYTTAFEGVKLAQSVLEFANSDSLNAEDVVKLNWLLLQECFPDDIQVHQEESIEYHSINLSHADRSIAIKGSAINTEIHTGDTIINQLPAIQHTELEIGKEEQEFISAFFVPPVGYEAAISHLNFGKPIWIVGPPDAGKGWLAVHLAASQLSSDHHGIYRVRTAQDWAVISRSEVSESTIILTNASYLVGDVEIGDEVDIEMDDETADDEEPGSEAAITLESEEPDAPGAEDETDEEREDDIHPLHRMISRKNAVIITCTDDLFSQSKSNVKLSSYFDNTPFALNHESYDRERKLRLVGRSISIAHKQGYIHADVVDWANKACQKLKEDSVNSSSYPIFQEWLPGKLHNFVISILVSAKDQSEIEDGFKVSLDDRVYSWFMELEESAKFFVLTRALLPELEEDELRRRTGEIIERLRKKYSLTQAPSLSVYAFHAAPFIFKKRPYKFINAHVASAVTDVIAEYFNAPFRELLPLFKQWSVPAEIDTVTPAEQDRLIKETAYVRDRVARMAGRVGGQNLNYVKELLDYWAGHPLARIGQAAGIALRHAVISAGKHREVFRLVEGWSGDFAPSGSNRRRSAADALGLIATAGFHPARCERAMSLLENLAKDNNRYVREAVSRALTRIAGMYSETVKKSLGGWAASDNHRLLWTTIFYLLANWGNTRGENALSYRIIKDQHHIFGEAASIIINRALRRRNQKHALSLLKRMINELAEKDDAAFSQQAALTLFRLSEKAALFHRPDVKSYVKILLANWSLSAKDSIRFTAFVYSFASCQNRDEKLALAKEFFEHSVFDNQLPHRMQAASRLAILREQDAKVVDGLLQDWLASGNNKACATVIFYWLIAKDCSEEQRCEYLIKLLSNFPLGFEQAIREANLALPTAQLISVLGRLALHERAFVRMQAALALSQMSGDAVAHLLQDLLLSNNPRACATVIFYWLAVIDRLVSYQSMVEVLRNFPVESAQAMQEAAQVFSPKLLSSVLTELAGRDELTIRLQASLALDGLAATNVVAANELLTAWANADNINVQKASAHALIISKHLSREEINLHLAHVISRSPLTFVSAIHEAWDIPKHIAEATSATARIAQNPATREGLVSALADAYQFQPGIVDDLMERFRVSDSTELQGIHSALRREQFKRKLKKPFERIFSGLP